MKTERPHHIKGHKCEIQVIRVGAQRVFGRRVDRNGLSGEYQNEAQVLAAMSGKSTRPHRKLSRYFARAAERQRRQLATMQAMRRVRDVRFHKALKVAQRQREQQKLEPEDRVA